MTLAGLLVEVVTEYFRKTEPAICLLKLWIAGYCNDHFGYLSDSRILAEGGYEALRGLGNGRRFTPEVEGSVMKELRELSIAAGRPDLPNGR